MKVSSTGLLETSVLQDTRSFAALEEEWQDLYGQSPAATPFQSWAWLYSWWESYGEDYELRLATLRCEDVLVGLLPLMLERRLGSRRLLFIGSGQSIYLDILVRKGWEDQVTRTSVETLGRMGFWELADLQQLRPEAATWGIVRDWRGPKACVWQTDCPVMEAKSWDELLAGLNQKQRSNTRRAFRKAQEDGVRRVLAETGEAEQAASRLVALHRESWQGRDISPEHLTGRFEYLVRAAAKRMTACGVGAISEFWRGEEVVASHLLIIGHDFVGGYLGGATGEALRRYSINPLYIRDGISVARDNNLSHFDLMWGTGSHKLQWQPKVVANNRAVLGRNPIPWAPYVAYHLVRSHVKRYVNSESALPLIKDAADKYRALRSKFAR
jgi:CelD/BcsL family acetyltransferase involved in cellulose biosynthesis